MKAAYDDDDKSKAAYDDEDDKANAAYGEDDDVPDPNRRGGVAYEKDEDEDQDDDEMGASEKANRGIARAARPIRPSTGMGKQPVIGDEKSDIAQAHKGEGGWAFTGGLLDHLPVVTKSTREPKRPFVPHGPGRDR